MYISPTNSLYITSADDSHTNVVDRCGEINFQFIKLNDVHHVLSLSNNLTSICKLTKDNTCLLSFTIWYK